MKKTLNKNIRIVLMRKIHIEPQPKNFLVRQQGFSLVELMVATAISIIVLLAASSTFLATYKLKEQVKTRINYEQDVRNASNVIRSDMRQLANFSCMNPPDINELNDIFTGAFTSSNNKQYLSTAFTKDIGVTPVAGSKPLVLTFINDKLANNILASQCNTDIKKLGEHEKLGEAVSGVVYLVGTTVFDSKPGFYRINFSNQMWSAPELIVSNVVKAKYDFYYDAHKDSECPLIHGASEASAASSASEAGQMKPLEPNISHKQDLDLDFLHPPVMIKTTLSVNPNLTSTSTNNTEIDYEINASVRQGEVCTSGK
ncbi:PilW family protein [Snodgrassella alvi]|uniref:PilW family protein n=1 Tax=Snodgrassella alvi TaxID=1196083 RepID=UPI00345F36B6